MGGGGGLGFFAGTAGARNNISANGADPLSGGILVAAVAPGTVTDAGGASIALSLDEQVRQRFFSNATTSSLYEQELGAYRGGQPGIYNDYPVVFDQKSKAPHSAAGWVAGVLTSEKGFAGTLASLSNMQGTVRLIVYGDPKTGKPSSWTLLQWAGTGEMQPNTNIETYGWKVVPNAVAASSQAGFDEVYSAFRASYP